MEAVALSAGLIPPLARLTSVSIGGGHTNTFLRQVKAGVKSAVNTLSDENGNLNAERLSIHRPKFCQALNTGMKWFNMHWAVPYVWPMLPHVAQEACNRRAASTQSEIEKMLQLEQMRASAIEVSVECDWEQFVRTACCSNPPCASYMKILADYVKANPGELLKELGEFQNAFACTYGRFKGPQRQLGSEFLSKPMSLSFGKGDLFPYIINACIKAQLSSNKVVDGICKLLAQSHLTMLATAGNRDNVKRAEQLMVAARQLCLVAHLAEHDQTVIVGRFDVMCVLHLTKKAKEGEGRDFATLDDVAKVQRAFFLRCSSSAHLLQHYDHSALVRMHS